MKLQPQSNPAAQIILEELNNYRKIKRFFTSKEVAEFFSVKERTVRKWIQTGKLSAIRPNQVWLIPRKALEQFILENTNFSK